MGLGIPDGGDGGGRQADGVCVAGGATSRVTESHRKIKARYQVVSSSQERSPSTVAVVVVRGGRVVMVLDFSTQCHQYQRRNIESSQERNPVVAMVVIQGGPRGS